MEIAYRGGLADAGQMHFYEHARASYAFARLLSTAEHFRRTGRVAQKITGEANVDLIVSAPKQGSFITEVLIPVVAGTVPELADVPVRAMIAYIFHLLMPRSEETDETVVELAKIRAKEERDKARAAGSPSDDRARIHKLEKIVETQTATTRDALALVRYALTSKNAAVHRLQGDPAKYVEMQKELEAKLEQEKEIQKVDRRLQVLDPRSVARLTSRVRPMVKEMGLPLRRKDIKEFTIGAANENRPLAYFNAARVAAVESKTIEDEAVRLEARIHGYDRDAGFGKVSSQEFTRRLKFIVQPERRAELLPKILRAMHDSVDTVMIDVLRVLDQSKQPTSLILIDIHLDEAAMELEIEDEVEEGEN